MKHYNIFITFLIVVLILTVFCFTFKTTSASYYTVENSTVKDPYNNTVFSASSDKEAVEYALSCLTVNRSWIETIYLKGNLTLFNVEVPNCVEFTGDALIQLPIGEQVIFTRYPSLENLQHISFSGLTFRGNNDNDLAIDMYQVLNGNYLGVEHLTIQNCVFNNFYTATELFLVSSLISSNTFNNCQFNINVANDHGSTISANTFYLTGNNTTSYGIQIIDSNSLKILGNTFTGQSGYTIGIVCDGQFIDSVISDNTFNGLSRVALSFGAVERPSDYLIYNNIVSSNTFSDMPQGIALEIGFLHGVDSLNIYGNGFRNVGVVIRMNYGGLNVTCKNVVFHGNIASEITVLNVFYGDDMLIMKDNLVNGVWS